jgi:hypothetical protein
MSYFTSSLLNLDFIPIQQFTAPNGTVWHVFVATNTDSWWYEEPVAWEIFVAELSDSGPHTPLYVCGMLLSPGVFISTEREWEAALERLLPNVEGFTDMEAVD